MARNIDHSKGKLVGTIDFSPTWEGLLPLLLENATSKNESVRNNTLDELKRMARSADMCKPSVKTVGYDEVFKVMIHIPFAKAKRLAKELSYNRGFKFENNDMGDEHEFIIETTLDKAGTLKGIIGVYVFDNKYATDSISFQKRKIK